EVPVAVDGPWVQATEVADAGQHDRDEPVQELPHAVAPHGDLGPDRLALADRESVDGLLGPGDQRLLAGDLGQVADRPVKQARLADRLADAPVDHDLERPGDLHEVAELELVVEPLRQLGPVARLEARHLLLCGGLRRHRLVFLLEPGAGAGADPDLDAVLVPVGDPGRLAVIGAQQLDVGGVDPGLLLGDAAGLAAPLGRPDLLVPLDPVDPLDQHLVAARVDLDHPPGDAEVLAGHDHHAVVLAYLHAYSTSGSRLMIFMKRFSRSSRPTGPKMRVPRGFCCSLMITAAFSSKRMWELWGRRFCFFPRTTTALTTSPSLTAPPGMASFTVATMMSPMEAERRPDPPRTRMQRISLAPVLSATFSRDSCWIILVASSSCRRYLAFWMISVTRQRLVADTGRVSASRTMSPVPALFCSSWALSRVVRPILLWYRRCWRVSPTTTDH